MEMRRLQFEGSLDHKMCWPRFLLVSTLQQRETRLRLQTVSWCGHISPACVCRCASILIILLPETYTHVSEEF